MGCGCKGKSGPKYHVVLNNKVLYISNSESAARAVSLRYSGAEVVTVP